MCEQIENGMPRGFDGLRVLVVEDNALTRQIAGELLSSLGIRTEEAADGAAAVEMVEKGSYDLILMDVQMPRMDGREATRRIRQLRDKRKAGIPIIALTTDTREEDRRAAFRAGMDGFLGKPIDRSQLCRTITGIIQDAREKTE